MINIKPTFMFKIIMKVVFLQKAPNDFKYKFIWGEVIVIGFCYYIISILTQSSIMSIICPDTASA